MSRQRVFGTVKKYKHQLPCKSCRKTFTSDNGNRLYCEECRERLNHTYKECKECGEFCHSDFCRKCRKEKNIKIQRSKKINE